MEEQILKIILAHYLDENARASETAKEITHHIMEFIEWKDYGNNITCGKDLTAGEVNYYLQPIDEYGEYCYTLKQLYLYWINNVKK